MCDDEWLQFCTNEDTYLESNNNDTIRNEEVIPCPKPSDLYISTKSKIGFLNKEIDLEDVFWKIKVLPYFHNTEGVIKKQIKLTLAENNSIDSKLNDYQNNIIDIEDISKKKNKIIKKISIGTSTKDLVSYRTKKKGAFYNCFVLIFRINIDNRFKEMHVKIFNTGKMEIPGVPKDNILTYLLDKLLTLLNSPPINLDIMIKKDSFETVLINSNFNCGFNIQREILVDKLKMDYQLSVSYDPCSYPGIMCKYYYYPNKNIEKQDGKLYKDIELKEKPLCISFMIFRTGSVLIVGKCNTTDIIYHIYNFIKNILQDNYKNIYALSKQEITDKNTSKRKKIKKKLITCY